jgi:hypothetical protein
MAACLPALLAFKLWRAAQSSFSIASASLFPDHVAVYQLDFVLVGLSASAVLLRSVAPPLNILFM